MSDKTPNVSRAKALSAVKAGGEAARADQKVTDCPYGADTTDSRFLRSFWIKGHAAASSAQ